MIALPVATTSGDQLMSALPPDPAIEAHEEPGDRLLPGAVLVAAITAAAVIAEFGTAHANPPSGPAGTRPRRGGAPGSDRRGLSVAAGRHCGVAEGARSGARQPEDLSRLLVERANAGDVDGVVALYEPDAVLALPDGVAEGSAQIRRFYRDLLATRPVFVPGTQRPALRLGDIALTSTTLPGGTDATAEVARRGADGRWRWVLDRPSVLG